MEQIINSILDTDTYKTSMQNAVLQLYPDTIAEYRFTNRGSQRFNKEFLEELQNQINSMSSLKLQDDEYLWLKENIDYFPPQYLEYLKNYRYDPSQVSISLTEDNNLDLKIRGPWRDTILYEVPVMSLISQIYFEKIDTDWSYEGQKENATEKIKELSKNNCVFADFGTRRRRSFKNQDLILGQFKKYENNFKDCSLCGSSNIFFSKKYGWKAIGTISHEFTQAMQALESINHCNYYAMQKWIDVYGTSLGIALCDTITTKMFLKDFDRKMAMLHRGCRHDSNSPYIFASQIVNHYKKLGIDPMSKTIVFSDGLDVKATIDIKKYCEGMIKCSFGIGTFLTNQGFENSPPLNMVIKLYSINDFPTVKLSDNKGKENGDPSAISFMKWIVENSS